MILGRPSVVCLVLWISAGYALIHAPRIGYAQDSLAVLVEALKDDDRIVREAAADALSIIGPEARTAVPSLIETLKDESAGVRQAAAHALASIGPEARAAVPLFIETLEDESAGVRLAAADALSSIGPEASAALPSLLKARNDKDYHVRQAVDDALKSIGPEAVPSLIKILSGKDVSMGRAAADALGLIGPEASAAVPSLIKILTGEDVGMRRAAANALGLIGPEANAAVPSLIEALKDDDADVRNLAAVALGETDPWVDATIPALIEALKSESYEAAVHALGRFGRRGVSALSDALKSSDVHTRTAAAYALGTIGSGASTAVHSLIEALDDKDVGVRAAAAESLGMIGPSASAAISALGRALGHDDASVRRAAATSLGEIGLRGGMIHTLKNQLTLMQWWLVDISNQILSYYKRLPIWVQVTVWPIGIWLALTVTVLFMWLLSPVMLARLAMPRVGQVNLPASFAIVNLISLVTYFGNTQRPLMAWLKVHQTALNFTAFRDREPVIDRASYCDLGNEETIIRFVAAVARNESASLWIAGEGGCGKSTLAFEIGRRCEAHVLPLLVDEDWAGELINYIASILSHNGRTPTSSMIERLTYHGRILLILDGLSERGTDLALKQVADLLHRRLLLHAIITSRDDKPLGRSFEGVRVAAVGNLERGRLEAFVHTYAPNHEPSIILSKLAPLTRDSRPLSPLFARMAINQIVDGFDLPGTYTVLVLRYVVALCYRGERGLTQEDFVRAALIAAYSSVKNELIPQEFELSYLQGVLDAESDILPFVEFNSNNTVPVTKISDLLLRSGLLQRNTLNLHIRFSHDPIAEYLTAIYIVKHKALEGVRRVQKRIKKASTARGLAEALEDAESVEHAQAW